MRFGRASTAFKVKPVWHSPCRCGKFSSKQSSSHRALSFYAGGNRDIVKVTQPSASIAGVMSRKGRGSD